MIDSVILILHWACFLCMVVVPLLVIIKLFVYAARAEQCHLNLLYRAIASMLIWIPATIFILFMWLVLALTSGEGHYSNQQSPPHPTPGYIALLAGYLLVSAGTIYWVWREDRIKLP